MSKHFGNIKLVSILLVAVMPLAGCGGGDGAPAPVPIPEVVVLMKEIRKFENAAVAALLPLYEAEINLLEIRCAELFPPPGIVAPGNQYVLLVDVSTEDATRVKALGFQVFGPAEQSRRLVALCF